MGTLVSFGVFCVSSAEFVCTAMDGDRLLCNVKVVEDGYEFFGSKTLVTIFSAPNYCGEFDNCGAMLSVDDTLLCSFQVCG